MAWVLSVLVQTLFLMALGFVFVAVKSTEIRIVVSLAALFFIWRAATNPDFIYRRLARSCAFAGIATISLQKTAKLEWSGHLNADSFLHKIIVVIGDGGDFAAVVLFVAAVGFGIIDLVRVRLGKSSAFGIVSEPLEGHGQYIYLMQEEPAGAYRYQADVRVTNKSDDVAFVTGARLVRNASLFGQEGGDLAVRRDNVQRPPSNDTIAIAARSGETLVATFRFRDRKREFIAKKFPRLTSLYDTIFGRFTMRLDAQQRWARVRIELETKVDAPTLDGY
jgi:hypothetical protein